MEEFSVAGHYKRSIHVLPFLGEARQLTIVGCVELATQWCWAGSYGALIKPLNNIEETPCVSSVQLARLVRTAYETAAAATGTLCRDRWDEGRKQHVKAALSPKKRSWPALVIE